MIGVDEHVRRHTRLGDKHVTVRARRTRQPAASATSDAQVVDQIRDLHGPPIGMAARSLYGQWRLTALVRRHLPEAT